MSELRYLADGSADCHSSEEFRYQGVEQTRIMELWRLELNMGSHWESVESNIFEANVIKVSLKIK